MNRAELVVVMAKGYGAGRPVWTHRIKGKNNLAAALRPTAMLRRVVLANVQRGQHCRAVRSQAQSKDTSRRVGRRRMSLIGTGEISLPPCGEHRCTGGCNDEPAERQAT